MSLNRVVLYLVFAINCAPITLHERGSIMLKPLSLDRLIPLLILMPLML